MNSRRLTLLGRIAVVACLPYLALKLLWVLGFDIGVIEAPRVSRATWVAGNAFTFLLDAVAAVVAHTLTRPGGRRAPAWLLAFPLWMASGLLLPLLTGLVGGSLTGLVTGARNPLTTGDFLAPWVFGVVYGGFLVEAVTLLGAFTVYAHQRWGGLLRRPLHDLPGTASRAVQRIFLLPAAVLLAALGTVRILWGTGSTLGVAATDTSSRNVLTAAADWSQGLYSVSRRRRAAAPGPAGPAAPAPGPYGAGPGLVRQCRGLRLRGLPLARTGGGRRPLPRRLRGPRRPPGPAGRPGAVHRARGALRRCVHPLRTHRRGPPRIPGGARPPGPAHGARTRTRRFLRIASAHTGMRDSG